ncbi:hypothetical protein R6Q59_011020 [Mikania micrantha]
MELNHMKTQSNFTRNSLFEQGYLDEQQFSQLEDLQDDTNPNFVEEIVTLFFSDSMRLIHNVETALENYPMDFCKLDDYMHQFMGSSSRCIRAFHRVKQEHSTLKRKLETYFQMKRKTVTHQSMNWRKVLTRRTITRRTHKKTRGEEPGRRTIKGGYMSIKEALNAN